MSYPAHKTNWWWP